MYIERSCKTEKNGTSKTRMQSKYMECFLVIESFKITLTFAVTKINKIQPWNITLLEKRI